ncbi:hypothetical protein [Brevundimonas sp. M20]|uniref:hypothetical protein n=1 Tax=Brevundimonas sp. M20 TaxID=2591463 RepID=UPI001146DEB0|nr:hypothetical protein [Brevundimonas sp. M20]QDH72815.1 hypothetical protein FKQ52_04880 [Brevundimonas sp. M20]
MDTLHMTPSRRMEGVRAYDRAADAFGVVSWKAPSAPRFDHRPANDTAPVPEPTLGEMARAIPGWAVIVGGGVVAALMGAMLGGALHI